MVYEQPWELVIDFWQNLNLDVPSPNVSPERFCRSILSSIFQAGTAYIWGLKGVSGEYVEVHCLDPKDVLHRLPDKEHPQGYYQIDSPITSVPIALEPHNLMRVRLSKEVLSKTVPNWFDRKTSKVLEDYVYHQLDLIGDYFSERV